MNVVKLEIGYVFVIVMNSGELGDGINDVLNFVFFQVKRYGLFLLPIIHLALFDQPDASFVFLFKFIKIVVDNLVASPFGFLKLSRHLNFSTY
jgi:hypothetical protein